MKKEQWWVTAGITALIVFVGAICFGIGMYLNEFTLQAGVERDAKIIVHQHFSALAGKRIYSLYEADLSPGILQGEQGTLAWVEEDVTRFDHGTILTATKVCDVTLKTDKYGNLIGIGKRDADDGFGSVETFPPVSLISNRVYHLMEIGHPYGADCWFRRYKGTDWLQFGTWAQVDSPRISF